MANYTEIMYRIIPIGLEWIWLDPNSINIDWTQLACLEVFGARLATLGNLLQVFLYANAARPPSPMMSHPSTPYTLESLRDNSYVVPGRRMGLFRNTAPSLVLIVPIKNVNSITVVLFEAV